MLDFSERKSRNFYRFTTAAKQKVYFRRPSAGERGDRGEVNFEWKGWASNATSWHSSNSQWCGQCDAEVIDGRRGEGGAGDPVSGIISGGKRLAGRQNIFGWMDLLGETLRGKETWKLSNIGKRFFENRQQRNFLGGENAFGFSTAPPPTAYICKSCSHLRTEQRTQKKRQRGLVFGGIKRKLAKFL